MAGRGGESACLGDERACRGSVCDAHGIAGNRHFPGTLTFDDPAVADELILPNFSSLMHPNGNQNVVDNVLARAFTRLLTEKLAVSVDSSWIRRNRTSFPQQAGFGLASLTLKGQVFEDDPHEALVAARLSWGIGRLGNQAVGAGGSSALQPGVFFGKGLGNLPDRMAWLRPFGVAGAVTAEFPISRRSTTTDIDPATGRLGLVPTINGNILHWGLALEYSTLYLTDRFTGPQKKSRSTSSCRLSSLHATRRSAAASGARPQGRPILDCRT